MIDKNLLIELTNTLYRLTLFFPKKEPLRYKMREVASDILIKAKESDFETLDHLLEVALLQDWVKVNDLLAVKENYAKMREDLKENKREIVQKEIVLETKNPQKTETKPSLDIQARQEKILAFLKEKNQVQVWQVKELFPQVSKRTLRRDFENMLEQGLIDRVGEKNNTFYRIK